jgi:hypothetical protein
MGIIYEVRFPSGKYWLGQYCYNSIDDVKNDYKRNMNGRRYSTRAVYKQRTIENCNFEDIVFTIREVLNTYDTTKLRTRLYAIIDAEQPNSNLLPHRRTCL